MRFARSASAPRPLTTPAGRRFALTVLFRKRITSAGFFGGGYDVGEDDVEDDISGDEYEAAADADAATDAAPTWRRPVASLDEVLLEAALSSLMAQDPRREALVAAHAAGKCLAGALRALVPDAPDIRADLRDGFGAADADAAHVVADLAPEDAAAARAVAALRMALAAKQAADDAGSGGSSDDCDGLFG